jgi:membrane fusion protein
LIAFSATATYAGKEKVGGWLPPQAGLIRLTARQGGIVENVRAMEGQSVHCQETAI